MKLINVLQLSILTLSIAACGGGGGGSGGTSTPTTGGTNTGSTSATTLSGSANKGIISNGYVEAFEVLANGQLSDSNVGSTRTDTNGRYNLQLSKAYTGGALKVIIKGGEGAQMVCDIPAGCNGTIFGQKMSLAQNFEMAAVVAKPTSNKLNININALTNLADKIANKNGNYSSITIAAANDVIRQAFALPQDITSANAVDITNKVAIEDSDDFSKRVALLSAALLTEVTATQNVDYVTAFNNYAATVKSNGGIILNDDDKQKISSVQDILEKAIVVLEKSKKLTGTLALDSVQEQIKFSEQDTREKPQKNVIENIVAIDSNAQTNVVKAKGLTADLRMLAASATGEIENGLNDFDSTVRNAFGSEKKLVDKVANKNLANLTDGVVEATHAMEAAMRDYAEAYDNGDQLPTKVVTNGLTVTISRLNNNSKNPQFSINQMLDGRAYNLVATGLSNYVETGDRITGSVKGDATINLKGSIQNSALKIELIDANADLKGIVANYDETNQNSVNIVDTSYTNEWSVNNLVLDINAKVYELNVVSPVKFDGVINLSLSNFNAEAKSYDFYNYGQNNFTYSYGDSSKSSAESLVLKVNGSVSDSVNRVDASVLINANSPVGINYTESYDEFYSNMGKQYYSPTVNQSKGLNETESNYIKGNAQVILKTKLKGIKTDAILTANVERSGLKDANANVSIQYDGKAINVKVGNLNSIDRTRTVVVKNQNNVEMTAKVPEEGEWDGKVYVGGEQVGVIEQPRDGLILIRYLDGSFESVI